tara:strand:- start:486 stop:674 length:189 start_codon:yes stop_codon:yes gene_type:complete
VAGVAVDQFAAQLVDLGMTGLLIGYLVRQNIQTSKINKELQDKYEVLLERAISALQEISNRP